MSRDEECAHVAIVDYLGVVAPDLLVFHPANGGLRSKAEARRLKAMGVLAGIPDLVLVAPGGRVFFVEIKSRRGCLSPAQQAIRMRMIRLGIPCITARSIDDVRLALCQWGLQTREARAA